jgi:photosystem II stability/assembly factor-like uncharacterized protein
MRDLDRLNDVSKAQEDLDNYSVSHDNKYPLFSSGSYLPNYTNSKWNLSWNTLRDIAPTIGQDPINNWTVCANADQNTCWNATNATFVCPQAASVYEYSVNSTGSDYSLHIPFEYFAGTSPFLAARLPNAARVTTARWCIPAQVYSPFRQTCGDGAVNVAAGEQCDPPGARVLVAGNGCSAVATCDEACHIPATSCTNQCGNGQIDRGEACDDGSLNDTYNHCSARCDGPSAGPQCGDAIVNLDSSGHPLEYCDIGDRRYTTNGYCDQVSCHDGDRYTVTPVGTLTDSVSALQLVGAGHAWTVGSVADIVPIGGGITGIGSINIYSHIIEYVGGAWVNRFTIEHRAAATQNSISLVDVFFPDVAHGYAVGDAVYRSSDSGRTWSTVTIPSVTLLSMLRAVYFVSASEGWAVGDGGHVFHTTDFGATWHQQTTPTSVNLRDVYFLNQRVGVAVGDRGTVLTTADSGVTWAAQSSGTTETLNSIVFSSSTTPVGWIVGNNGTVMFSTTYGVSWQDVSSRVITGALEDVSIVNTTTLAIVGAGGRLYITNNNGASWVSHSIPF